jgi:cathepsin L
MNAQSAHTFELAVNKFADMSEEEFYRMRTPAKQLYSEHLNLAQNLSGDAVPVDWRDRGAVNPIYDEGACDADWAMASTATLEGRFKILKNETLYSLSVQQLIDCSYMYGNDGCDEGRIDSPFTYAQEKGMMSALDYPYVGREVNCSYNSSLLTPVRPTGYQAVPVNNATALKLAVSEGPVSAWI